MKAFKKKQAEILLEVVEMVDDVVKAKDFEEINVFGRGRMNGRKVLIVGEAKIRLEEKGMAHSLKRRGKEG